ncbi:hypothetical protein Bca4012_001667 [Brassica carinata]|uniref:Uncharacterized protein n=3 Tax=Brassica TaxID=3705 RepID=A0A8X7RZ70_BRACI|nr:hypothetical protein Bca52824_043516 [Brassica carinata]KAG2296848.1 hypothetical protein Bca52824_043517 [Brassica carinata]CAF1699563.1 unnamed protein product [Brassica napus]CDY45821.1 BnaC03g16440D [Brassica napus]VDC88424.1 unnamed protein product [Brassica oleracea]
MCGMSLAFNRELVGPAPISRYDDMWLVGQLKLCVTTWAFGVKTALGAREYKEDRLKQSD